MIDTTQQQAVDAAITSRRSIRAFLPAPVAREDIEAILAVAARAPSGTNTQPWRVYVLTGQSKEQLSEAILAAYLDPQQAAQHTEEYSYYPREWKSPFIDRRRKVGWDLYALLGLTRDDKPGMAAQHGRNYRFFDAPVRRARGSTMACSCKTSWWRRADAGSIPARRRPSPSSTASSPPTCNCRPTRWWCAAWRSGSRTRTRSKIP
jgi:hypothetical protein